ncbi:MAG: TetR/AcrR family transcriptional regulator [Ferruginibacter sp.]
METLATQKVSIVLCPIMAETNEISERIRQKAHELFMQYGLRSVSMDDIANNLGISKKTIYQYYADKDELVDAVINAIIDNNKSCCEVDHQQSENAVHEIFLAMEFMMEIFRSMNPSLLHDLQKYHPVTFQKFSKHKNDYLYTLIKENILRGIREELYRPELRVDVMARFRVNSVMLPFAPEFHNTVKFNLGIIEEEITIHYLFGLVSQKGYKLTLKYQQERNKKINSDEKSLVK